MKKKKEKKKEKWIMETCPECGMKVYLPEECLTFTCGCGVMIKR
jgi:predicted RNA-binding Zn-ribbon protein involved in translation (DUF1610 family)